MVGTIPPTGTVTANLNDWANSEAESGNTSNILEIVSQILSLLSCWVYLHWVLVLTPRPGQVRSVKVDSQAPQGYRADEF